MSIDLIVFSKRTAIPSPSGWQKAINDAGFPVDLDTDFDVDTFSGFLPCKLRGIESGFEYLAVPLSEAEAAEAGAPQGSDFSVTLTTHSDLRELACSAVASGALAFASGGLLVDPQSGDSFTGADALQWARQQFAEADPGP